MATVSPYSEKALGCRGHACVKCGCCRDWQWLPEGKTKACTKRFDATCTGTYAYGRRGYGPGCHGCCLHCVACCVPFANWCVKPYYGGGGYDHGTGIEGLNGYLVGGLNHHILILAGADVAGRRDRAVAAHILDIGLRGAAGIANDIYNLSDGTLQKRIAIARSHHENGHLCECCDNQH